MSFVIEEAGLLSTLQDFGRYGHQSTGISPSGALDYKSMILANQLVNNDISEAVIELTLSGFSFHVLKDTTIGTAGATMDLKVNGDDYPMGRAVPLAKGDFVEFGHASKGIRTYMSVAGGFKLEKVLGSYSTHLRTSMGGYEGRALEKGDILPFKESLQLNQPYVIKDNLMWADNIIRIIPGPNYGDFTQESQEALVNQRYTITRSADRMGIRLDGEKLKTKDSVHDILSEPTQLGNIQVPKNGLPIILLNDRQTTGGYKRMASVAKIDLPKLVQLRPDETVQFAKIELKTAVEFYRSEIKKIMNKEYLTIDTDYAYYRRIKSERVRQLIQR